MKIIEASAVISARAGDMSGIDKMAANLLRVSKAGQQMKSAFSGAALDMSKRVEQISSALSKIDNFKSMSRGLNQASTTMKVAQQTAARLKVEMDAVSKPTAKMRSEYARASTAIQRATSAFKEQGQAVRAARSALEMAGIPINQLARQQAHLTSALNTTTAAMHQQAAAARSAVRREAVRNLTSGAVTYGAFKVAQASHTAIHQGAEQQHAIQTLRRAGLSPAEQAVAVEQARKDAAKYGLNYAGLIGENRQAFAVAANPKDAADIMHTNARLMAAIRAIDPRMGSEGLAREAQFAIKAGEVAGVAKNAKSYESFINDVVRWKMVEGAQITMEQVHGLMKQGGMSVMHLAPEFRRGILGQMIAEQGGERVGTFFGGLGKAAAGVGGANTKTSLSAALDMGLLTKDQVVWGKNGPMRLKKGQKWNDAELLASNPLQWLFLHDKDIGRMAGNVAATDLDHARASDDFHGSDEQIRRQIAMNKLFTNAQVARNMVELDEKKDQYRQKAPRFAAADDLGAAEKSITDVSVAADKLAGSMQNLLGALTAPGMDTAAKGLNAIADYTGSLMRSYSEWAKDNPTAATAVVGGVGATGIAGAGFAATSLWSLVTAGPALNEAAVALNVAAARLGAAGAVSDIPVPGKKPMGHLPRVLPALARWTGYSMLAYGGYEAARLGISTIDGIGSIAAGQYWTPHGDDDIAALNAQIADREGRIAGIRSRLHPSRVNEPNYEIDRLSAEVQELRNRIASARSGGLVPALPGGSLGTLNWGLGGGQRLELVQPTETQVSVTGSAQNQTTINLVPTGEFSRLVQQVQQVVTSTVPLIGGIGPGSTGRSMQEAEAPVVGSGNPMGPR